jgi:hypothetical protein
MYLAGRQETEEETPSSSRDVARADANERPTTTQSPQTTGIEDEVTGDAEAAPRLTCLDCSAEFTASAEQQVRLATFGERAAFYCSDCERDASFEELLEAYDSEIEWFTGRRPNRRDGDIEAARELVAGAIGSLVKARPNPARRGRGPGMMPGRARLSR